METSPSAPVRGRVVRLRWILREHLKADPSGLYVFGDNMARHGMGGQAREMRGEGNALGVPTKWLPSRSDGSFFQDKDLTADDGLVKNVLDTAFNQMEWHLASGRNVYLPHEGIGTGLAELGLRAPLINAYIQGRIAALNAKDTANEQR